MVYNNITQTINGRSANNTSFFDVINPATEDVAGKAPECTDAQIDEAMEAAVAAHRGGWLRDRHEVKEALSAAAKTLSGNADELAKILVAEQGKPITAAMGEVLGSAAFVQFYADFEPTDVHLGDGRAARGRVSAQSIGPTLGITAWNIPLLLAFAKIAPAIAAGNPIVIKPSPYTPLSTLRVGELLAEVFPPGVLQVLTGSDALGPKLTGRPEIRKISMTGSIATGSTIYAAGAKDFKRITLELGGNDAAVLLDDFDAATMSERLFAAAFENAGQLCICAKRIFVPQKRIDEIAASLAEVASNVILGPGNQASVTMGPVQNRNQFDKVAALIDDAVERGATIVTGGKRLEGPGYFVEPTILKDCTPDMRVVAEEQFGPVMPLIAYSDVDEALRLANETEFGLGGSVWGADVPRAESVAERMYSGMVWVNCHGDGQYPNQPFVGVKSSGLGAELGTWGYNGASDLRVDYTRLI